MIYVSDSTALGRTIEKDFTARAKQLPEKERISAFNAHMGQFGQLSDNAGELHGEQAPCKGKWLASDFHAGDVVFHDPHAIHGSSRNEDGEGRIRLSTDLDERWMKYWVPGNGL